MGKGKMLKWAKVNSFPRNTIVSTDKIVTGNIIETKIEVDNIDVVGFNVDDAKCSTRKTDLEQELSSVWKLLSEDQRPLSSGLDKSESPVAKVYRSQVKLSLFENNSFPELVLPSITVGESTWDESKMSRMSLDGSFVSGKQYSRSEIGEEPNFQWINSDKKPNAMSEPWFLKRRISYDLENQAKISCRPKVQLPFGKFRKQYLSFRLPKSMNKPKIGKTRFKYSFSKV